MIPRTILIALLSASVCLAAEKVVPVHAGVSTPTADKPAFSDKMAAIRFFPTWETLQPSEGKWNFKPSDEFIAAAKSNSCEITGIFHAPPSWLSKERPFPLRDTAAFTNYIANLVSRYGKDVARWEVFPGYNSGSRQINTPFHYVELLTIARKTAREIQPDALIGFSLANYDLEFLDDALRDGAGGQFDFISLSPFRYSPDSGDIFADLIPPLRRLLQSHGLSPAMPIIMTLVGEEKDITHAASLGQNDDIKRIFLEGDPEILAKIPPAPEKHPTPDSFTGAKSVEIIFGEKNKSNGLILVTPFTTEWDSKLKANRLTVKAEPPIVHIPVRFAPGFISTEVKAVEITVTAKWLPCEDGLGKPSGLSLNYEATFGTRNSDDYWAIPSGDSWQTHTWKISDANFISRLGWNFRLDASGSGNDLLIQKIVVSK